VRASLAEAMRVAANPKALLEQFDALESSWSAPERTGYEKHAA
jgi:hypothetical protein